MMESLGCYEPGGFWYPGGSSGPWAGWCGSGSMLRMYSRDSPGILRILEEWKGGNLLLLDPATQRNLEALKTT